MRIKAITLKATVFAGMLLFAGLAKAQSTAPTQLPFGDKSKAEWVKANPEAYRQMGGQVSTPTTSKAEIKASHQMTDAEKQEWIKAHPAEYAKLAGSVQAAPKSNEMPKYVDTGNPTADEYAYGQAKSAWIAAHPSEYAEAMKNAAAEGAGVQRVKVTQFELNDMSPAKRQAVLADPNVDIVK